MLQEAGISGTATRDKWPLEVLKKVMESLGAEVPAQLLARELFCGAASAADWLQRQRAFAGSAAVMSMVWPPLQALTICCLLCVMRQPEGDKAGALSSY